MGKRKDAHPSNDDRVDFIHVGTEFPSAQEQLRRRQREQRGLGDDKPKCYSRDAFKGGFSAGYFGTVGSKDGWKPTAEFVSSRNNRAQLRALRPEDFMDAEDIADLHAARVVTVEKSRPGAIGVVAVKLDHRGAGYGVDLASLPIDPDETSTEPVLPDIRAIFARKPADPTATKAKKKKPKKVDKLRLSFGAFEDDDDDYEASTRYKSKKSSLTRSQTNDMQPSQLQRLVDDIPAKHINAAKAPSFVNSTCHDGRPPLAGFVLAEPVQPFAGRYAEINVPSTFTGTHTAAKSRWDSVPATGAESQLNALGSSKSGLVTAADRSKIGVMEPPPSTPSALSHKTETLASSHIPHMPKVNAAMLSRFVSASSISEAQCAATPEAECTLSPKNVVRTIREWVPSRILCKRMGVPPPEQATAQSGAQQAKPDEHEQGHGRRMRAADFMDWGMIDGGTVPIVLANAASELQNEEPPRPEMALFQAIFGNEE